MSVIEALTGGGKALIPNTATLTLCSSTIIIYIKAIVFNIKAINTRTKAFNKCNQTI